MTSQDMARFVLGEALSRPTPDVVDDGREVWQVEYFALRNAVAEAQRLLSDPTAISRE